MSETTLDQIRHWRDRAAQGVVTPLTTVQIIRLCDAAERAETLEADCEVERMRLAACMTAALGNTRDAVEHRITRENPYWSAAYGDVCRAVDAGIALREERDALAAQLTEVTRERDAIQATYDEFCAKFPSKSVMRRQAAMRDPADPPAPTPEVSVTRAQAEDVLTDRSIRALIDHGDLEGSAYRVELRRKVLELLWPESTPTPR